MKKFFSLVLILIICLVSVSCGSDVAVKDDNYYSKPWIDVVAAYTDVEDDDWYTDAVSWGVNQDIMVASKPTAFGVTKTMTKSELIVAMWKAAGAPGQYVSPKQISDSDPNSDVSKAMKWAVDMQIVHENDVASLINDATRLDAIDFLWNQAQKPNVNETYSFDDTVGIDSVAWAKTMKITYGIGHNLFGPDMDCTKAHMITFLYRAK